jgi:hypothetical protein
MSERLTVAAVIAANGRLDQARTVAVSPACKPKTAMARMGAERRRRLRHGRLKAPGNRLTDEIAQLLLRDS